MNEQQLRWHLRNNIMPSLNEKAINGIVDTWKDVKAGTSQLTDTINESDITIAEMFEDLKLEEVIA